MGIGAEKVLVQKSGYFSRSAPANTEDLRLIKSCTDHAVTCAIHRESGVIGHDEDQFGVLRAIEFDRVKGGKPFDTGIHWFQEMLSEIGQKMVYPSNHRTATVRRGSVENLKVRINTAVVKHAADVFS